MTYYEIIQTGGSTFAVGEVSNDPDQGSSYVTEKNLSLEEATQKFVQFMGYDSDHNNFIKIKKENEDNERVIIQLGKNIAKLINDGEEIMKINQTLVKFKKDIINLLSFEGYHGDANQYDSKLNWLENGITKLLKGNQNS